MGSSTVESTIRRCVWQAVLEACQVYNDGLILSPVAYQRFRAKGVYRTDVRHAVDSLSKLGWVEVVMLRGSPAVRLTLSAWTMLETLAGTMLTGNMESAVESMQYLPVGEQIGFVRLVYKLN